MITPPGHFWRDKWTALRGPLSETVDSPDFQPSPAKYFDREDLIQTGIYDKWTTLKTGALLVGQEAPPLRSKSV